MTTCQINQSKVSNMPKSKYTDPNGYCLICGFLGVDLHHIKSRGSGGKDDDWNIVPLCHPHHQELHQIGTVEFAENNYEFEMFLHSNGWELLELPDGSKKWIHSGEL